jgi:hypothetical protein
MRRSLMIGVVSMLSSVGCSDSSSVVQPMDGRAAPDFLNGPEDPGPFIARDNSDPFFMLFNTDRSSGLAALIRLPAPGVTLMPCGGTTNLDASSLQLVFHASGAINQLLMGRGVQAFVYDRAPFVAALIAGGLCNAIATQVPIAGGRVDFNAHDNDTFLSGAHPDAFGWSARGLMTSVADGSLLRFQSNSHGVLSSDGSLIKFVNSISLNPAPGAP